MVIASHLHLLKRSFKTLDSRVHLNDVRLKRNLESKTCSNETTNETKGILSQNLRTDHLDRGWKLGVFLTKHASWPRIISVRMFLCLFKDLQYKASRVLRLCVHFFGNIISKVMGINRLTSALTGRGRAAWELGSSQHQGFTEALREHFKRTTCRLKSRRLKK